MKSKRSVTAILLMLVISWSSYRGYDINFFQTVKPIIKHSINFFLLFSVALIGIYATIQFPEKWIMPVWILGYAVVIILLILIGIVDIFYPINSHLIRDSIAPFRLFFTSPLPFLILLFLRTSAKQK